MNKKIVLVVTLVVLSATVIPVTGLLPTKAGVLSQIPEQSVDTSGILRADALWPMFRNDAGNSGCTENYATNTNHIAWQKYVGGEIGESTPILYDDKLYVSSGWYYKGLPKLSDLLNPSPPPVSEILNTLLEHPSDLMQGLFCLNADTGESLWNKSLEYPSNPAVVNDKVYITAIDFDTYNTILYCFDAATGEHQWQVPITGLVLSPTIVSDGKIFLNCLDLYSYASSIKCFDLSGIQLWSRPFGMYELAWFSAPAVSGENVFCITMDLYSYYEGKLYCLNTDTGAIRWSKQISSVGFLMYYSTTSPACFNGNVYVLEFDLYTYGGSLKCFNGDTGAIEWNYNLGTSIAIGTPAICEEGVYVSAFDLNVYSNRLYCFNPATGTLLWTVMFPYSPYMSFGASPVCSADKILLIPGGYYDYSMQLYCFEKENGSEAWNLTVDSYILGAPSIGENRVYLVDNSGQVYMLEDVLKIQSVMGGVLGVKALIQNTGDTDLSDITWTITVKGGLLGMINRTRTALIPELRAGKSKIALLLPIIGVGAIEVMVTATMPNMNIIKMTRQGVVLGSVCLLTP